MTYPGHARGDLHSQFLLLIVVHNPDKPDYSIIRLSRYRFAREPIILEYSFRHDLR